MPRLSGYRVSSMSARARPDAFLFSFRRRMASTSKQTKGAGAEQQQSMVAGVGYFGSALTEQQAVELGSSSVRLHLRFFAVRQCPLHCNATQRKHTNSHSQARCPVAAQVDGFCACVPDSRPPCVFIHGNKAARAWPLLGFVCWRMTGTHRIAYSHTHTHDGDASQSVGSSLDWVRLCCC